MERKLLYANLMTSCQPITDQASIQKVLNPSSVWNMGNKIIKKPCKNNEAQNQSPDDFFSFLPLLFHKLITHIPSLSRRNGPYQKALNSSPNRVRFSYRAAFPAIMPAPVFLQWSFHVEKSCWSSSEGYPWQNGRQVSWQSRTTWSP